jgi:hypothetical protein
MSPLRRTPRRMINDNGRYVKLRDQRCHAVDDDPSGRRLKLAPQLTGKGIKTGCESPCRRHLELRAMPGPAASRSARCPRTRPMPERFQRSARRQTATVRMRDFGHEHLRDLGGAIRDLAEVAERLERGAKEARAGLAPQRVAPVQRAARNSRRGDAARERGPGSGPGPLAHLFRPALLLVAVVHFGVTRSGVGRRLYTLAS